MFELARAPDGAALEEICDNIETMNRDTIGSGINLGESGMHRRDHD
jgi:hypothetical protein